MTATIEYISVKSLAEIFDCSENCIKRAIKELDSAEIKSIRINLTPNSKRLINVKYRYQKEKILNLLAIYFQQSKDE